MNTASGRLCAVLALGLAGVAGCKSDDAPRAKAGPAVAPVQNLGAAPAGGPGAGGLPPGHPPLGGGAQAPTAGHPPAGGGEAAPADGSGLAGKVLETMDAGGYTYARLAGAGGEVWVAVPQTRLSVGDSITVTGASLMQGFTSKTLGRTFDAIYFGSEARTGGAAPAAHAAAPAAHGAAHGAAPAAAPAAAAPAAKVEPTAKAEGPEGRTIAEIQAQKAALAGKPVTVRGRVTKFNAGIMGKNWLHLDDGSGTDAPADLTVTTQEHVKVGDVVLVRGTVQTDQDFGGGYRYDLIVQEATLVQ